jgi:pyruvate dehydrogenase E1 component alpha subunit
VALKAAAYGLPGITIDGNDVIAVYETARTAIARAREGEGPSLIECKTFRMSGHSAHDDMNYVPPELLKEWEEKDPILRLETYLKENQIATEAEIQQIAGQVVEESDAGVALAEEDSYPSPEETLEGVYASPLPVL